MTGAMEIGGGAAFAKPLRVQTADELIVKSLDVAGLRALSPAAWDQLSAAALVENPFYDRRHVFAALDTIDRGKRLRALAFHTADAQLVGLFLTQPRGTVPAPFSVANGFANFYQFGGTPLLHREHAGVVAQAWAEQVAEGTIGGVWALPDIDAGSATTLALQRAAKDRGLHWRLVIPYERAYLTRLDGGFDAHLDKVLSKNRLKDVRRTMRRLGEVGTIALEHVSEDPALTQRLETFLQLEHSGWKGAQGTSFLSHEQDAAFARAAYVSGIAAIDSLLLDGKPIAMKLSIRTGRTAFTPKIAYDEAFKKLGPGMALEYLLIEAFYASDDLDGVDAAATAEGHSALNFFNTHKAMGTVIVGRHQWQIRLLASLHEARKTLKSQTKAVIAQWKARRNKPATDAARMAGQ